MFVQQLSGINAVMFYCGTILQSVYSPDTANLVAIGIQALQTVITIVSAPIMDKAGRVPVLLFAATVWAGGFALGDYLSIPDPSRLCRCVALAPLHATVLI